MIQKFKKTYPGIYSILARIFSRENLLALILALLLIATYIATAGDAPIWLYQGF